MEGRFGGTFPGGPSRRSEDEPEPRRPRTLRRAEDLNASLTRRRLARKQRDRFRRASFGILFAMVAAGGVGFYVGWQSHRSQDEVVAEQSVEQSRDLDISAEVNRTLLELWKMEEAEALRGGRGR